jgi:hypothetical protein
MAGSVESQVSDSEQLAKCAKIYLPLALATACHAQHPSVPHGDNMSQNKFDSTRRMELKLLIP